MSPWDGTPELGDEGAPPTTSPAIISVTGDATGLIVFTDAILSSTLLDYYIDGVLVESDQRTMVLKLTDDGTNPLAVDTDYTVTVVAHNTAGSAAASAGVTARLDPGMTPEMVVAILAAGTVITGALYFGSTGVLDSSGITVTQTDGRQTYIRADGSGNQFVGQATLDAATILGNLGIYGQTNGLGGLLTLQSGVTDPTTKPSVTSAGWDSLVPASGNYGLQPRGLFDNGASWYYVDTVITGNVNNINKSTGARTLVAALPSKFNGIGGVVKIGTSWYVLGQDGNRSNNWYVYIYNASWVKTGEWVTTSTSSSDSLTLGLYSTSLAIAKRQPGNNLYVSVYTTAGVQSAIGAYGTWAGASLTGIFLAAVDTATVRFVVSSAAHGVRVFDTGTGARVSGEEWTPAAGALGLGNDGSNWFTLDAAKVWKYTNLIGTYDFAFTWVDNDAGGTGTAETKKSALRTVAPTKRSKWTIGLPSSPPDDLTTDGANTANLYAVATGGTLVIQTALAEGTLSATYSTLATSGAAPPGTNGFAARAGALGRIASVAIDGSSNPYIDLKGDGSGRIGPWSWDTGGVGTQDNVMVTASGNAAPTSTTNVTIPGISSSVTSLGTTSAWMVDLCCDVLIGASAGGNIVGLLIDGAEHASLIVSAGAAAARFAATKRYRITGLSAGSHTFTARTRSQGSYTTTVNQTHSTMTVERCA